MDYDTELLNAMLTNPMLWFPIFFMLSGAILIQMGASIFFQEKMESEGWNGKMMAIRGKVAKAFGALIVLFGIAILLLGAYSAWSWWIH